MMREAMQNSGLEVFAEVGLALFVAAFLMMLVRVTFMTRHEVEHIQNLPLDDGQKN